MLLLLLLPAIAASEPSWIPFLHVTPSAIRAHGDVGGSHTTPTTPTVLGGVCSQHGAARDTLAAVCGDLPDAGGDTVWMAVTGDVVCLYYDGRGQPARVLRAVFAVVGTLASGLLVDAVTEDVECGLWRVQHLRDAAVVSSPGGAVRALPPHPAAAVVVPHGVEVAALGRPSIFALHHVVHVRANGTLPPLPRREWKFSSALRVVAAAVTGVLPTYELPCVAVVGLVAKQEAAARRLCMAAFRWSVRPSSVGAAVDAALGCYRRAMFDVADLYAAGEAQLVADLQHAYVPLLEMLGVKPVSAPALEAVPPTTAPPAPTSFPSGTPPPPNPDGTLPKLVSGTVTLVLLLVTFLLVPIRLMEGDGDDG